MKHRFIIAMATLLLMQGIALPMPAQGQPTPPPGNTAPAPNPTPPANGTPACTPQPGQTATCEQQQCTDFQGSKNAAFGGNTQQQNQNGTTSTFTTNPNGSTTTTVTDANGNVISQTTGEVGLLSAIYNNIKAIVNDSTERLFNAFIGSNAYQSAVFGAMTLMIIVFGVGFVIGVIQPSFGQVLQRLIKFGIILTLISPGGWEFFSSYMVTFFNDGTDDLIKKVMEIGTGVAVPPQATPFYSFDRLASFLIQPDTIIAIMGSLFAGGPYGAMMGGLMIFSFMGFMSLLITALRIYAVSYVARALLLGLAPIFFVFLLFEKTKQLFMTWVNALLSLMLQPVLLFTFLSFFMVLIESASRDMLNTEFCWTEYRNEEGTTNKRAFWRPAPRDPNNPNSAPQPIISELTWRGSFDCVVSGRSDCPEFPMNVVDIMTFLILVYLAQRFAVVIERIANELANSYVSLDTGGRLEQMLGNSGGGGGLRGERPPAAPINPERARTAAQQAAQASGRQGAPTGR